MSGVENRTVGAGDAGQRLDRWFRKHFPALGQGGLQKLLRKGQVRVDGRRAKANHRLEAGQVVRVPPLSEGKPDQPVSSPAYTPTAQEAETLRESVLYRDEAVLAIDKPAGLAVQGGSGQRKHLDAMLDALRFGAAERPRLVHRLDKDTSGVLVLARSAAAARSLTRAFRDGTVRKLYWAAVLGQPKLKYGEIDLPLGKSGPKGREKMLPMAPDAGEEALTRYVTVATTGRRAASWLALRPVTGRTHQLRVHCAAIGHPILGDGKYGGKQAFPEIDGLPGQLLLHARSIALPDPASGVTLRITAPPPAQFLQAWRALGFDPDSPRGDPFED
ncbi:MAG: RluA family pseudouridine synthase [Rhodovibrionaceae bacterium]